MLLRNIAQKPTIDFNIENVVGIGTQLRFVGREDGLGNDIVSQTDVNKNMVPKGGIIVSVRSSQGIWLSTPNESGWNCICSQWRD